MLAPGNCCRQVCKGGASCVPCDVLRVLCPERFRLRKLREFPFAKTTLTLYDHAEDATFAACFERIETILHKFNMYSSDSEIFRGKSDRNRTVAGF